MPPPVLVAGLDGRSLLLEASVLRRDGHTIEELGSARDLLARLGEDRFRLVVLGPRLPDLALADTIRRIRADPATRAVSVLALIPAGEAVEIDGRVVEAGANAVLRRPLEETRLDSWVAKLLSVPRRVRARVPVQGHVVGTPRTAGIGHFVGLTRNISVNGILLASPVALPGAPDVELEMSLPDAGALKALGRIVRQAPEVAWPYLGYGVEFLYIPEDSLEAIITLIEREVTPTLTPEPEPPSAEVLAIRATVRREIWVYEILDPVRHGEGWQVEIRRAPREVWRPGSGGPFYVVEEASPEEALATARAFVRRHG